MTTGESGGSPNEGGSTTSKEGKDGSTNNKKGNWQHRQGKQVPTPRQTKFEGKCDDLKGHIYDCSDSRQADQFTKTTREIAEYVGRTYKYGGDARVTVENLEKATIRMPDDLPEGANKTMERIWEKEVDEYVKRKCNLEENVKTIYSLVWGQCSDIMRQKLEALDNFNTIKAEGNGVDLLKAIKSLTFNFQSQKYLPHSIHESKRRFYLFSQGKMTTVAYHEQFLNIVEVISTIDGSIGVDPGTQKMVAREKGKTLADLTDADRLEAEERYLAVAFILGADRGRYGKLIENLENDFLQNRNSYPQTVTSAYNLLINWKQDPRNLVRSVGVTNDGVSFANIDGTAEDDEAVDVAMNTNSSQQGAGKKRSKDKTKMTCRRCGQKGHYPSECDNERLVRTALDGPDAASTTSSLTSAGSSAEQSRQTGATMVVGRYI